MRDKNTSKYNTVEKSTNVPESAALSVLFIAASPQWANKRAVKYHKDGKYKENKRKKACKGEGSKLRQFELLTC